MTRAVCCEPRHNMRLEAGRVAIAMVMMALTTSRAEHSPLSSTTVIVVAIISVITIVMIIDIVVVVVTVIIISLIIFCLACTIMLVRTSAVTVGRGRLKALTSRGLEGDWPCVLVGIGGGLVGIGGDWPNSEPSSDLRFLVFTIVNAVGKLREQTMNIILEAEWERWRGGLVMGRPGPLSRILRGPVLLVTQLLRIHFVFC